MRITFGLALDGARTRQPADRLGEPVLGPLGLLNLLETQLGLNSGSSRQSERIVQYGACLKQLNDASRFYYRSFETDEYGTAATLLGWRDRWHLHGWDGSPIAGGGARLSDIAEVEGATKNRVALSPGQRLERISVALQGRKTGIERVRLIDPLEAFPKRWQNVLQGWPLEFAATPSRPVGRGFLRELQESLLPVLSGRTPTSVRWRDDGTVIAAQAETRLLAGQWLANQLEPGADRTLLVAEQHGFLLDELLASSGRSRQGYRDVSVFRPTLQLLPLALALIWDPLDVGALLQFLTHPVCPLPAFARRQLAEKIAMSPGVGGEAWNSTIGRIASHYGERAVRVREDISFWVEHKRYDAMLGAPIDALVTRVQAVREFFLGGLADDDPTKRAAHSAGHLTASAVAAALETIAAQGDERLWPRQLEQLLAQATARGSDNPLLPAEVGAGLLAQDPAAVLEPVENVVWWQMEAPGLPGSYPWSRSEIKALAGAGVELPSIASELGYRARAWLRPILAAKERLVLVLPPADQEVHPLWLVVQSLAKGSKVTVRGLEGLLNGPAGEPSLVEVEHRPLPGRRRWWRLPNDAVIAESARASYSSLNLYLNNPYQWVLQYPARLRTSTILGTPDNFTLFGNLAHSVVERWYRQPDALQQDGAALRQWFDEAFPETITHNGASLLMPGRRVYLEGLRRRLGQSLQQLHEHLRAANPRDLTPEAPLNGTFEGGPVIGSADLLLIADDSRPVVVDMKWAGDGKYGRALADNEFLQLVVYSECVRQSTGSWPRIAYYILSVGQMLTPEDGLFPDARVVRSKEPATMAELWQRFLIAWRWRREQLQANCIELVFEDTEPTDESQQPEGALPVLTLGTRYDPFVHLAGWER